MKLVRSMLTIATVVAMSASFSWGQCCGGASYDSVGMAAPAVVDGGAGGCGCSYTVMRTVRRTVYEQQQVQRTRTCLLYTSPSPRDRQKSRMPSSA